MERILIGDSSEILIGRGWPSEIVPPSSHRTRLALITQAGASAWADEVATCLAGIDVEMHVIPDGEGAKTLEAVADVYEWLASIGLGRTDTIVAVGGGAATDSGGFIAATWMRGVEVVYVPTTLLGAVDAAIGGKTGINVGGKNLVGVFRHPSRVVVNVDILAALPHRLLSQGAAEIIKVGLLAEPWIVDDYRQHGLGVDLERIVTAAIAVKAGIVERDFTEQGARGLLNLGHTIGHGVEFGAGIPHGEAVAIGLVAAAAVSEKRLGFEGRSEVVEAVEAAQLPAIAPPVDRERVLNLIGLDKKRVGSQTRMALLEAPGKPQMVDVTWDDIDIGLDAIGL